MSVQSLFPSLDLLRQEYVLIQAWKKTASHIRNHNWYSDTLELDRAAVDLPFFLGELKEQLESPKQWCSDPLRIVPAPKSQPWHIDPKTKVWGPLPDKQLDGKPVQKGSVKLRPLAHVSLKDQVVATAIMLCLADRVESCQGDPRLSAKDAGNRTKVLSYGNRLFCDQVKGGLRHRWGSSKLYRSYFQDYRSFLARPDVVAESIGVLSGRRTVVVHSDLSKFYDRVSPLLLSQKLASLSVESDDTAFFKLSRKVMNWGWHKKDSADIESYKEHANLKDFAEVALPQGLVSAGFFANVALLDFDDILRTTLGSDIEKGIHLVDACRYVDDLRLVLVVDSSIDLHVVEHQLVDWLQKQLDNNANGLEISAEKTKAAVFGGNERPVLQQSRKMARIQNAVSGGFDAMGGEDIIDAVQGLVRSQKRYSDDLAKEDDWGLTPVPDVGDSTVARFSAARFRSTYRSLRPLLHERADVASVFDDVVCERKLRTRAELDEEAKVFALGLIDDWLYDPSNVRLLRIGLDIWPDNTILSKVLDLLFLSSMTRGGDKATRQVAWYCLSELFRAGVTETGFVEDDESLPAGLSIKDYRSTLRNAAVQLATKPKTALPWYLMQQVYLCLAANRPKVIPDSPNEGLPETTRHRDMIHFLSTAEYSKPKNGKDCALVTILARRCFGATSGTLRRSIAKMTPEVIQEIALRDPSLACEIIEKRNKLAKHLPFSIRKDLCLLPNKEEEGWVTLSRLVMDGGPTGPLRNELSLLCFATLFLSAYEQNKQKLSETAITPCDVLLKLHDNGQGVTTIDELEIVIQQQSSTDSMYAPPTWCQSGQSWRFQLGYLIRFILTARPDFTKAVRTPHWKERNKTYRTSESHWFQRLNGHFNGQSAFGDDWLPISDWLEYVLAGLLAWPGYPVTSLQRFFHKNIAIAKNIVDCRIQTLEQMKGKASGALMLPLSASRPYRFTKSRPLRACVVQTVTPTMHDYESSLKNDDLTLSLPEMRRRHRKHLSTALSAVEKMLTLRKSHNGSDGRLDWLILPELAVHPKDVQTHLVRFARNHKTIILAGVTYQELLSGEPLVNSALWIIPVWSRSHGLQTMIRRQGKQHLAPSEDLLNVSSVVVRGFRPCQWLIGYEWQKKETGDPLWLTASICYDATDLRLASDLREQSDIFAIPAVNMDVNTYDHMALALHYHMFQMVIVANNGEYGGSNAYVPYKEAFEKQVFHLHGQPQASIGFLEISNIGDYLRRKSLSKVKSAAGGKSDRKKWKHPPAGI